MSEVELRFVDKSGWPDGPWKEEPDKVFWKDEKTYLDCLARRINIGAWCGYVGVPETHSCYGKSYDDSKLNNIEVHYGLTFSGACQEEDKEHGICHPSEHGDKVWWFGFDCAHCDDFSPGLICVGYNPRVNGMVYKDLPFVKEEIKKLAQQLSDMQHK